MRQNNVRRLIVMSGAVVNMPGDGPSTIGRKFMSGVMNLFLKDLTVDGNNQAKYIVENASDIDWTIIRPPYLTEGPK